MGDRMRPIPFDQLIEWILGEFLKERTIFGIPESKFFRKGNRNNLSLPGGVIENPLGVAAGPNTQLAQNIISAYVTGSRFFELKTVQVLDGEDLPVSKPCIWAGDEGYNVEWSTEITVPEAFNEYIKAWFVLNVLSKELSLGSNSGFMFNMSVGYDLEGIKSAKIDSFINGMKDASGTDIWKECKEHLLHNIGRFRLIDKSFVEAISPEVCRSVTLSTLHGCPPREIERIAGHLIGEKQLNTSVKCNPTMLGCSFARETLDKMGYGYIKFDDHHFRDDLQFEDAVPLFERLKAYAQERGLIFGLKLSNTLPVKIEHNELPGSEMYMSGRPLYPLTVNLAYRLAEAFQGDIRISFAGGADFFNISGIYRAGLWPVTLTTNILKPGGYLRLKQLADLLEAAYKGPCFSGVDLDGLKLLAESSDSDLNYLKERHAIRIRKLKKKLPLTDCFIAPCREGCPVGQDIPEYIRLVGEKRYLEALEVIVSKNPLPFITGNLCTRRCMTRCTRFYCDEAVGVRNVKLLAAERAFDELLESIETPAVTSDYRVAVIGGGPAGLSGAYFLARNGVDVTVFEKRADIGGVIRHAAPGFRISRKAVDNDMELIRKTGVKFRLGTGGKFNIEALRSEGFKYIFIATGAWKPRKMRLDPCDREPVSALEFLEAYKRNCSLVLGRTVVVVGAGNSAMDAARAAKRLKGVEKVSIIYRRTKEYMPADEEELKLALEEGIEFQELLSPIACFNGQLRCQRMALGAQDSSGRRSPVPVKGEFVEIAADSVIAAVGEQVEADILLQNGIELDTAGRIKADTETNETGLSGVYAGGDALRGPATIVEGIADGKHFAETVLKKEMSPLIEMEKTIIFDRDRQTDEIRSKRGVVKKAGEAGEESSRCLECNYLCNICVDVCPNRANLSVSVGSASVSCKNQIIHIDGMCNECGNCATFCPYDSAPSGDKLTLFWKRKDFDESRSPGFYLTDREYARFLVRLNGEVTDVSFDRYGICYGSIPREIADLIWTVYSRYPYVFVRL